MRRSARGRGHVRTCGSISARGRRSRSAPAGQLRSFRYHAADGRVPPECHQQLAGQGDEEYLPHPPLRRPGPAPKPLRLRALRLVPQPAPCQLNELRADPGRTGLVDPLVPNAAATGTGRGRETRPARKLSAVAKLAAEHLGDHPFRRVNPSPRRPSSVSVAPGCAARCLHPPGAAQRLPRDIGFRRYSQKSHLLYANKLKKSTLFWLSLQSSDSGLHQAKGDPFPGKDVWSRALVAGRVHDATEADRTAASIWITIHRGGEFDHCRLSCV